MTQCPRGGHQKLWRLRSGKLHCAQCRTAFRPGWVVSMFPDVSRGRSSKSSSSNTRPTRSWSAYPLRVQAPHGLHGPACGDDEGCAPGRLWNHRGGRHLPGRAVEEQAEEPERTRHQTRSGNFQAARPGDPLPGWKGVGQGSSRCRGQDASAPLPTTGEERLDPLLGSLAGLHRDRHPRLCTSCGRARHGGVQRPHGGTSTPSRASGDT